ncbi:MAG: hypothetical protein ABH848_02900 [Candidatus Omnitrophota bacterium]
MTRRIFVLAILLVVSAFMFTNIALLRAEEQVDLSYENDLNELMNMETEEVTAQEEQYAWGAVKSITPSEISISEFDYELEKDVAIAYVIDKDTKLDNFKSISEISMGDNVEVEYIQKDDQKIAKTIALEKEETDPELMEGAE